MHRRIYIEIPFIFFYTRMTPKILFICFPTFACIHATELPLIPICLDLMAKPILAIVILHLIGERIWLEI